MGQRANGQLVTGLFQITLKWYAAGFGKCMLRSVCFERVTIQSPHVRERPISRLNTSFTSRQYHRVIKTSHSLNYNQIFHSDSLNDDM